MEGAIRTDLHCIIIQTPSRYYGAAITRCIEDSEGRLWVDNGEYSSQVNYCPFTGIKAKIQTDE